LKPLKKASSIQTAGFSAISGYFCHKKHKKRREILTPFCVFCAFCGRDYSLELFRGLKLVNPRDFNYSPRTCQLFLSLIANTIIAFVGRKYRLLQRGVKFLKIGLLGIGLYVLVTLALLCGLAGPAGFFLFESPVGKIFFGAEIPHASRQPNDNPPAGKDPSPRRVSGRGSQHARSKNPGYRLPTHRYDDHAA
jgi:hypothetical protein